MTTHRVTAADFDILIGHWQVRLNKLLPGTAPHDLALAKIAELEKFKREEFGAEQDEAWQRHAGG